MTRSISELLKSGLEGGVPVLGTPASGTLEILELSRQRIESYPDYLQI